jgi:hypothetical protein
MEHSGKGDDELPLCIGVAMNISFGQQSLSRINQLSHQYGKPGLSASLEDR